MENMQNPTESAPDTRRFVHRCPRCQTQYRVRIRVDLHQLHRATCPHCQNAIVFDNRDGSLQRRAADSGVTDSRNAPGFDTQSAKLNGAGHAQTPPFIEKPSVKREPVVEVARGYSPSSSSGSSGFGSSSRGSGGGFSSGGSSRGSSPNSSKRDVQGHSRSIFKPEKSFAHSSSFKDRILDTLDDMRRRFNLPFGNSSLAMIGLVGLAIGFVLFIGALISIQIPDFYLSDPAKYVTRMKNVEPNRILDRNGVVVAELFARKTGSLRKEDVPDSLKKKIVFVEDQNFYSHGGIHWPSVIRALLRNMVSFGYAQGGSTITQQLARILLTDQEKTIFRKLREASLAYHLERHFSKEEILLAYLNHVYLGHGATGMDVAARFYFNKGIKELSFSEELTLVCLPSAPERFSPVKNPDELEGKMQTVFDRMKAAGFTDMTVEAFHAERTAAFAAMNRSPGESVFGSRLNNAPFLAEYLRLKIREILGEEYELGAGLRIETTVDARLQTAAVTESVKFIRGAAGNFPPVRIIDGRYVGEGGIDDQIAREYMNMAVGAVLLGAPQSVRTTPRLQTASIGIDPPTGEVLFLHGGTEFTSGNQLNRAIGMRRQTGSAIKPIIYSAAIESGAVTASTMLDDTPLYTHKQKRKETDRDYWLPENITGVYEGSVSVRRALVQSKNVPAIRVARLAGLPRVGEQFRKFFFPESSVFDKRFRPDETIAIGSLEMSPLEMASAFTAFANNGVIKRPILLKRIVDSEGRELYAAKGDEFKLDVPPERQAIPGDVAEVMSTLLVESARYGGTGYGGYGLMGKTGTTNDNKDAWFVGVLPHLSMAVWVGYDNPAFSMQGATGAGLAGPLWGRIANSGGAGGGSYSFSPRASVMQVCRDSGKIPVAGCPETMLEFFARGHAPKEECDRHSKEKTSGKTQKKSLNQDSDFD